jgi:hypothetical protein
VELADHYSGSEQQLLNHRQDKFGMPLDSVRLEMNKLLSVTHQRD